MLAKEGSFTLGLVDMLVILGSMSISIFTGIYYCVSANRSKSTLKSYLLADKKGSIIPISLSIMASYLPASILVGSPSEAYTYGTQFFMTNIGKLVFSFVNAYFYFPVYFKMQLISPYEYLEQRFNYNIRCLGAVFSVIVTIFSNAVTLYVPSLALQSLTSLSLEWSIILISSICAFYSIIGGIKAVIITDVFQSILMYATLIFIILVATIPEGGGFFNVMENADKGQRLQLFLMDLDPTIRHTFWNTVIGGGLAYLSSTVSLEVHVQRFMVMKTLQQGKKTIILSAILIFIIGTLSFYAGLSIYNIYTGCDPVKSNRISKYDEIVPLFVSDHLYSIPGATGLFISGIIAASLSSASSGINSLAAMITEDFIKPLYCYKYKTDCPEQKLLFYAKLCALLCSILSIIISFSVRNAPSVLELVITFQFSIVSPLLGIFTLGMFFPFSNENGALYGFLTGVIIVMGTALGGPKPPLLPLAMSTENCAINATTHFTSNLLNTTDIFSSFSNDEYSYVHRISYLWYPIIGLVPTVVIGVIISYVTNYFSTESKKVNFDLLSPIVATYLKNQNTGIYQPSSTTQQF